MSVLEWKNVNLFQILPLAELSKLKNFIGSPVCFCYNEFFKVICDSSGYIHIYQKNWECISFQTECKQIKLCSLCGNSNGLLLIVQQDDISKDIFLQIFSLQKMSNKSGAVCLGVARLHSVVSTVNAIQAYNLDSLLCIAMGLETGDIYFFKGTISRDISQSFKTYSVSSKAVTGIGFKKKDSASLTMFISSNAGIFSFLINDNNSLNESKVILDSSKEISRLSVMGDNVLGNSYFTVARDNAVYCFTAEDRGPCYFIDGEKKCIDWFGNYLIVALKPIENSFGNLHATTLILVDVQNKMIVLRREIDNIWNIIVQSGQCYVITSNKEVYVLRERTMKNKINLLLKKHLYDIALGQLEACSDFNLLAQVNLQYGDYFFQKGETEKAVEKYIKTIGYIKPYYIIQKLLDSRYTNNLITYLESLLSTKFAIKDHYDLFVNCCERIDMPLKVDNQCYNGFSNLDLLNNSSTIGYEQKFKISGNNLDISSLLDIIHDINRIWKFFENKEEHEILKFLLIHQRTIELRSPGKMIKILKLLIKKQKITLVDQFLAILIPNTEDTLEYLQYATQHSTKCSPKIFSYIFKKHLESWQKNEIPENNLLEFLKENDQYLCNEQIILLCKMYNFWVGIVNFLKKLNNKELSTFYLLKKTNVTKNFADDCSIYKSPFIMEVLGNANMEFEHLGNFANSLMNASLKENPNTILQVIEHLANNKEILVGHINDFFNKKLLHKITIQVIHEDITNNLQQELINKRNLYTNHVKHPIEFRNSMCNSCRQELTFPAVYFLCQHAFHKDCLNHYSDKNACMICSHSKIDKGVKYDDNDSINSNNENGNLFVNDPISRVAELLREGIFNDLLDKFENNSSTNNKQTNPFEDDQDDELLISTTQSHKSFNKIGQAATKIVEINGRPIRSNTNPFENYDDNLNPFAND